MQPDSRTGTFAVPFLSTISEIMTFGISLIAPTYRRADSLRRLLGSLAECEACDTAFEVIVVDNANDSETQTVCRETAKSMPHLRCITEHNAGLSNARNTGIVAARYEYVVLLDDDVTFTPNWLNLLAAEIAAQGPMIYCPRLVTPREPNWEPWLNTRLDSGVGQYDFGEDTKTVEYSKAKIPVGAAVAFPKEFHQRFGPFNTNLDRVKRQLLGGSDTLFFNRAFAAKIDVRYVGNSVVFHHLSEEKLKREYWLRQAYDGGRSLIRMKGQSLSARTSTLCESVCKAPLHLLWACLARKNSFTHLYSSAAHAGRMKESLFWWGERIAG
jgi:glycosyltransferase involved in cell wall biosynthesis